MTVLGHFLFYSLPQETVTALWSSLSNYTFESHIIRFFFFEKSPQKIEIKQLLITLSELFFHGGLRKFAYNQKQAHKPAEKNEHIRFAFMSITLMLNEFPCDQSFGLW